MFLHQPFHLFDAKILVIDSHTDSLNRTVGFLQKAGYSNVRSLNNIDSLLDVIKIDKPDLVILDVIYFDKFGFDAIRKLRSLYSLEELAIIVLVDAKKIEKQQEAWLSGVNDVMNTSVQNLELVSRVYMQLHRYLVVKELNEYQNNSDEEVRSALNLQLSLLPEKKLIDTIQEKNNVLISSIFKPCHFLSGDLWGLVEIDENQFAFWSADFSGKGIQAALNAFRVHTIVNNAIKKNPLDPACILSKVNEELSKIIQKGKFSAFLYGVINRKKETLTYAAASHPSLILYEKGKKECIVLSGSGVPLGVDHNTVYSAKEAPLKKGESLLIYSDALTDPKNILGLSFENDDGESFVASLGENSAINSLSTLMDSVHGTQLQLSDDLTFIEIHLK